MSMRANIVGSYEFHPFSKYLLTSCSIPSILLLFGGVRAGHLKVNKRGTTPVLIAVCNPVQLSFGRKRTVGATHLLELDE